MLKGKAHTVRIISISLGVILLASIAAFLTPGIGSLHPAGAQVNLQKIQEQTVGTISEGMSKTSLEQPQGEETPQPATPESPQPTMPEQLPPGESAEDLAQPPAQTFDTGEGSPYYISCEGLGGKHIADLDSETMRSLLAQLPQVQGNQEILDTLMPIMERFQVMVRPPMEKFEKGQEPWESGAKRYSPFDPAGGGAPPPRMTPVPPFPPIAQKETGKPREEPTATDVASRLKLVGILGGEGNYVAILKMGTEEKRVSIGDELVRIGEAKFVIGDITLNAVKIINATRPTEPAGIVQFSGRQGISNISISY